MFIRSLLSFFVLFFAFLSFTASANAAVPKCVKETKGSFIGNVDNVDQCRVGSCYEPIGGLVNPNSVGCYQVKALTPAQAAATTQANTTSAVSTVKYKDATLSISHTPANPTFDTQLVTITVTSDKDIFLPSTNSQNRVAYSAYVRPDTKVQFTCKHTGTPQIVDTKTAKMTISIARNFCNMASGPWKATLYIGEAHNFTDIPVDKKIVADYPLVVGARDSLQVSAFKTPLAANEPPTIIITNAVKGRSYTFYWEGQATIIQTKTAAADGHFQQQLDPKGLNNEVNKKHKLCVTAQAAPTQLVSGLTCEASTLFEFSTSAVVTAPNTCTVDPAIKDTNTTLVIKALNIEKNRTFRADLVTETETKNLPESQGSGAVGGVTLSLGKLGVGKYDFNVYKDDDSFVCTGKFEVKTPEEAAKEANKKILEKKTCTTECASNKDINQVCLNGECVDASRAAGDIDVAKNCLNTAIGCVPISLNAFINGLLAWTAGIAGGIAFLLMLMGSLEMVTSQGNAEQLKKGREQFIAAISGLLFIIFSITLLQIIGADILGIFPR